MKIQIISFHCVVRNRVGTVVSSTFNHNVITHVEGHESLPQNLAKGLQNLRKGEKRQIFLAAEQAYGLYDPELVIEISRRKLSQNDLLRTGHRVITRSPDGKMKVFQVTHILGDRVTLDGNHPLAGQDLIFDIEATDAREATSEELAESYSKDMSRSLH